MKVLQNIEEVGLHYRALAELDALGAQDNSAWTCIHRIVEITDEHWRLEEATYKGAFQDSELDDFNDWNWEEHHYGVEYRSCWSTDPDEWHVSDAGVEARIILAGGGPAVRIIAELDGYGSTDKFIVEHANWSEWEAIDFYFANRLSEDVRNYVWMMVERYVSNVAGWIQAY